MTSHRRLATTRLLPVLLIGALALAGCTGPKASGPLPGAHQQADTRDGPLRIAVDVVLDPVTAARKVRALAAQATQTAGLIAALGVARYTAWVGEEAFVEAVRRPASGSLVGSLTD